MLSELGQAVFVNVFEPVGTPCGQRLFSCGDLVAKAMLVDLVRALKTLPCIEITRIDSSKPA
jgi:hypothetical protein